MLLHGVTGTSSTVHACWRRGEGGCFMGSLRARAVVSAGIGREESTVACRRGRGGREVVRDISLGRGRVWVVMRNEVDSFERDSESRKNGVQD
jgi:hypothetical protein